MIEDYYNQTFSWYEKTGVTESGDASFGVAQSGTGRIQLKKTVLRDENGVQVVSDALLNTGAAITPHAKVEYTDSTGTLKRFEVIEVYESFNKSALHHREVKLINLTSRWCNADLLNDS